MHTHNYCRECRPDIYEVIRLKIKVHYDNKRLETLKSRLVKNGHIGHAQHIKAMLIQTELKVDECEECGQLPEHNGKPLILQLDHVNGDPRDWRIENLRILCPNCHTQTSTYANSKRLSL